ncbi:MAG: TonB-dependent receptor [Usitatibacter sp.]
MKQVKKRQLCIALAAAMGASMTLSLPVAAQQTKERIEVTGSNIKRVDTEGPNPVTVIRREDLERSGGQNLQDVLNRLPSASLGSFSESQSSGNSFAPGTAGISLRGLGPQTTLVLVNGRRVAIYGFAQNINSAFVDLNSIPVSAIERIEILKDGASAIYGSDAIAGVVNVILRKDFRGVEANIGYGATSGGGADERRATLTAGFGDIASQRFNVMATVDWYKRDPLYGSDRPRTQSADFRRFSSYGGFDFRSPTGNPGTFQTASTTIPAAQRLATSTPFAACPAESRDQAVGIAGTCAFNFLPILSLINETERKGVFGRGVFEFSQSLSAFAEFGWNKNESNSVAAPSPDAFTLPIGHNSNPYPFRVPIAYRFTDVGPRLNNIESESTRYVLGLKGAIRNWDWEAAYLHSRDEITNTGTNYVSAPARTALLNANVYSFIDNSRNSPALIDSLRATPVRTGDSRLKSFDAKVSGTVVEMPAGPLGLALGAERREESISDARDPLSSAGLIVGSGGTAADGSRHSSGFFGELSIPLTRDLEAQVALRHERYSDYGNSTVPKYALAWRAKPNVLLRAGYNEGFRAPALAELYLGQSTSFLAIVDTTRCAGYRTAFGTADPRSVSACAALQTRNITGGNPNLTAEESRSESLGLVWDVTPRFSTSVDYYRITHKQRIATPSSAFIVANEDLFPGAVTRDPQTANDVLAGTRGPIVGTGSDERVGLRRIYFNATSQATRGVDVEFTHRVALGNAGNLTLTSTNSYIEYFRRVVNAGRAAIELAGNDGLPRYRGTHTALWSKGPWDASLAIYVIGRYNQPFTDDNNNIVNVTSFTTGDVQASYSGFRNIKLTAGVRNVTDREPPFYNGESSGYDTTTHNILGRFYYARLRFSFR